MVAFAEGVFVFVEHFHLAGLGLAAEVAVGSRFLEDGVGEAEALHDEVRSQVDQLLHLEGDVGVAHLHM